MIDDDWLQTSKILGAERDAALAREAKLREIHAYTDWGQDGRPDRCSECRRAWPCATIRTLDGDENA